MDEFLINGALAGTSGLNRRMSPSFHRTPGGTRSHLGKLRRCRAECGANRVKPRQKLAVPRGTGRKSRWNEDALAGPWRSPGLPRHLQMEAERNRPSWRDDGGGHCQMGSEVAMHSPAHPRTTRTASVIKMSLSIRWKPIPSTRQGATTERGAAGRDEVVTTRAIGHSQD